MPGFKNINMHPILHYTKICYLIQYKRRFLRYQSSEVASVLLGVSQSLLT